MSLAAILGPSRVVTSPNNSYTLQPGFIISCIRLLIKLRAPVHRGNVVYQS